MLRRQASLLALHSGHRSHRHARHQGGLEQRYENRHCEQLVRAKVFEYQRLNGVPNPTGLTQPDAPGAHEPAKRQRTGADGAHAQVAAPPGSYYGHDAGVLAGIDAAAAQQQWQQYNAATAAAAAAAAAAAMQGYGAYGLPDPNAAYGLPDPNATLAAMASYGGFPMPPLPPLAAAPLAAAPDAASMAAAVAAAAAASQAAALSALPAVAPSDAGGS